MPNTIRTIDLSNLKSRFMISSFNHKLVNDQVSGNLKFHNKLKKIVALDINSCSDKSYFFSNSELLDVQWESTMFDKTLNVYLELKLKTWQSSINDPSSTFRRLKLIGVEYHNHGKKNELVIFEFNDDEFFFSATKQLLISYLDEMLNGLH